jgi:hypothetical protein
MAKSRDAGTLPLLEQAPQVPCIRLKLQLAEKQQLISESRQLMRSPDNSGHQGAVSGVAKADVASLFSEAHAWSLPSFADQRVHAVAANASLSSEATARCRARREGLADHTEPALFLGALGSAWRYHHADSESGASVAWAG